VLLCAQATDISVNAATRKLNPRANTRRRFSIWAKKKLREYVQRNRPVQNQRPNKYLDCKILLEKHGGEGRTRARRWKRCRESGARPPMWC